MRKSNSASAARFKAAPSHAAGSTPAVVATPAAAVGVFHYGSRLDVVACVQQFGPGARVTAADRATLELDAVGCPLCLRLELQSRALRRQVAR